jgi:aspartate aminotransferase
VREILPKVELSGIIKIRDKLLQMENPMRLESGEPDFDTPQHIKDAISKALRDNHTHYAPSSGIAPLKKAIYRKLCQRNNMGWITGPERVSVTNGGMHALHAAFNTILDPGDEVIFPCPGWTSTAWIIRLAGGEVVRVHMYPELGYNWKVAELENAITPKTRAVLINTPQNPTGGMMSADELKTLLTLAEKYNLYVVADEAYEDIVYEGRHVSVGELAADFPERVRNKIISCFTFSKSYAMTGLRLGYMVCNDPIFVDCAKKLMHYTLNQVATPIQYGGIAALEGTQDCVRDMVKVYRQRRDLLYAGLKDVALLSCASLPHGAFYLYCRISELWKASALDLAIHLADSYGLGSAPGEVFWDSDKALRLSYACSEDNLQRAIQCLKQVEVTV